MKIIANNTDLAADKIETLVSEFNEFFSDLPSPTGPQFFAVGSDGKLIGVTEYAATIIIEA